MSGERPVRETSAWSQPGALTSGASVSKVSQEYGRWLPADVTHGVGMRLLETDECKQSPSCCTRDHDRDIELRPAHQKRPGGAVTGQQPAKEAWILLTWTSERVRKQEVQTVPPGGGKLT